MKFFKPLSNLFLFSCLILACVAVLSSCGKDNITPTVEEVEVKPLKDQLEFNRTFTIQDSLKENTVSFKVYANDQSKLNELTNKSFKLEPVMEIPAEPVGAEEPLLFDNNEEQKEINLDEVLFIDVEEPTLKDGVKGVN